MTYKRELSQGGHGPRVPGRFLMEIVAGTDAYRRLAGRVLASDHVIEIGCSWGHCTEILAQHAAEVLGLDCSRACVEVASKRVLGAGVRFERVDALAFPERLLSLGQPVGIRQAKLTAGNSDGCQNMNLQHLIDIGLVPADLLHFKGRPRSRPFGCAFVDIGGSRCIKDVVQLLTLVEESLCPEFIVVKSEELAQSAEEALQSGSEAVWWEMLQGRCSQGPRWQRRRHPLDGILRYPPRSTLDGEDICRFVNYGRCHKGVACTYSHNYCHCCLQRGHFAQDCRLFCAKQ